MKICYISPLNNVHTYRTIRFFNNLGYEIHCIWYEEETKKIKWINYYSYKENKSWNFLLKIPFLKLLFFTLYWLKTIRKIKPDITHLQFLWIWTLIALIYKSKKLVTTIWWKDILLLPKKVPFYKKIVKKILKKSNYIIVEWYNTFDEVLSYWIEKEKIKRIWFWINTIEFRKIEIPKEEKRVVKIISTRLLEPENDVETLIYAAIILRDNSKKFTIDIFSEGSQKQHLMEMVHDYWLEREITFKWKYIHKEIPLNLNESDIYVSVSLIDSGLSLSTFEAMACWLPVIVTDNADNARWIENGINWFVIPEKSPEKLAEKIAFFIDNKEQIQEMWNKNITTIENQNEYNVEMNKINDLYLILVN